MFNIQTHLKCVHYQHMSTKQLSYVGERTMQIYHDDAFVEF